MITRACDGVTCRRRELHSHEHDSNLCSREMLGIGGCPGAGSCQKWIDGAIAAARLLDAISRDRKRQEEHGAAADVRHLDDIERRTKERK